MARRTSGEIYQVDLIAALFGGFMISWLVSAQETEFQVYSKPLKFATIEMRVAGDFSVAGSATWFNAFPSSTTREAGCIGTDLARDLVGGIQRYEGCTSESAKKLNTRVTSPSRSLLYWNNVVDNCKASVPRSAFPRTQSFYANWALEAVLPDFLSPIGTVHRTFDPMEIATSPAEPYFNYSRSSGNCSVRQDDRLVNQVFLISDFDQKREISVGLPISSGKGTLLLTGVLRGSAPGSMPMREILFSDVFVLVNSSNEIDVGGGEILSNLNVQALLCVFSEGTETCYGGQQPLTNAGAPALTLTKGVEPW